MKEFCYTIKNAVGVHARPAGALARMAEKYDSTITIQKMAKMAQPSILKSCLLS